MNKPTMFRGVAAVATLCAIGVLMLLQGWASDGSARWSELRASSDSARELLADFDAKLNVAEPGATFEIDASPGGAATTRHGVEGNKSMIFAPYSLKAWVDLRHPAALVRIEVKRPNVEAHPPIVNEVLVLLVPREVKPSEDARDDD